MVDLKAHVLHGKSFHVLTGPVVIPIVLAVAAITAASFFLNAVFAFAIASEGPPMIRPAFTQARSHLAIVLGSGAAVGLCLGLATVVVTRRGPPWFALSLSIVIGVMMVCYVAVPARLIGVKTTHSTRDKLTATAVGGALGAVVCTPPYVLGRVGLIMVGSHTLFIFGCVLIAIGLTLQAGATGAVKAIKMSAKLVSGRQRTKGPSTAGLLAGHGHAHLAVGVGDQVAGQVDGDGVERAGEPERGLVLGGDRRAGARPTRPRHNPSTLADLRLRAYREIPAGYDHDPISPPGPHRRTRRQEKR
jgi:hypothetical protein